MTSVRSSRKLSSTPPPTHTSFFFFLFPVSPFVVLPSLTFSSLLKSCASNVAKQVTLPLNAELLKVGLPLLETTLLVCQEEETTRPWHTFLLAASTLIVGTIRTSTGKAGTLQKQPSTKETKLKVQPNLHAVKRNVNLWAHLSLSLSLSLSLLCPCLSLSLSVSLSLSFALFPDKKRLEMDNVTFTENLQAPEPDP